MFVDLNNIKLGGLVGLSPLLCPWTRGEQKRSGSLGQEAVRDRNYLVLDGSMGHYLNMLPQTHSQMWLCGCMVMRIAQRDLGYMAFLYSFTLALFASPSNKSSACTEYFSSGKKKLSKLLHGNAPWLGEKRGYGKGTRRRGVFLDCTYLVIAS